MNMKSLLIHFLLPIGSKNSSKNRFKDELPLKVYALVCVHTSMTSFSSHHLKNTMERRRCERGDEKEERRVGRVWGKVVFSEEVKGQVIKSVRLLATSSNQKELINAVSQACGSANQLSNQCLAMPMPSEWQEQDRVSQRKTRGVGVGVVNQRVG